MPESVSDRISRWLRTELSSELLEVQARIEYLAAHVFHDYEPTRGPSLAFLPRCRDWLDNTSDEADQRLLVELVPNLLFVSRGEFEALYRCAFNERVIPWIVELLDIRLDDPTASAKLDAAISETWFCAGTDSMPIASFCHVNKITGMKVRPDFKSLRTLSIPPASIASVMEQNGIKRIVILDDFVGSATQIGSAISLAAVIPGSPAVLLCPLICCPNGRRNIERAIAPHGQIAFNPVFEPPSRAFIAESPESDESPAHAGLRQLAIRTCSQVCSEDPECEPFGFRSTGALIVLHTNCPNNTLPLVHQMSPSWKGLFPRSKRV